jgi:hypothetical protein
VSYFVTEPWNLESLVIQDSILVCSPDPRIPHTAACPTLSIPYFHLSACIPSRTEDSGRQFFSQALCIQVAGNRDKQMMTLLKTAYKENVNSLGFVPWDWKKGKKAAKDAFRDAMVAQSNYVANCYVVPVHGITEVQMKLLKPRLLAAPAIESVEHTKYTAGHGRWDVICKKIYFSTAKASVLSVLQQLDTLVPSPQTKLPFRWKKWSELHLDEESSQGDYKFLTTSARTYASMVTDADRENKSITDGVELDLSQMENPFPAPTSSVMVPTAVVNTEVTQEMLALKAHIKQQDEKIARMEAMMIQNSINYATSTAVTAAAGTLVSVPDSTVDDPNSNTHESSTLTKSSYAQETCFEKIEHRLERMMTAMTFMTAKMDDVMDTVMDDRTKRDHDDVSIAANSSEQQSPKKSDNKPTPTKKSRRPSLEKAAKRQVP